MLSFFDISIITHLFIFCNSHFYQTKSIQSARTREPKGFLAGGLLASARSPSRENSCQPFSNTLRPLRYPLPFQKQSSEVLGLRVSEVKTIKYRFCRSEVPRCEKIKHGLPCDDFRHKSGRGKRTRRVSQRLLVGKASVIRPKRKKRTLFSSVLRFGADYGARTRHLHLGKVALYQMS